MSVFVDSEKCKGCSICVSICPVQAISIIQNKAFINQNICNECLQCISECPNDAIYQISEKEISVTKRQDSTPYSVHRTPPQSSRVLWRNERKQRTPNRSGSLLDRIKGIASTFFEADLSFGRNRKGGRMKYRGQRKRHRGGRF